MPENTTINIEGNIIWTVTTTTAASLVACTRMGTPIFPLPDAQLVEPMDTDV